MSEELIKDIWLYGMIVAWSIEAIVVLGWIMFASPEDIQKELGNGNEAQIFAIPVLLVALAAFGIAWPILLGFALIACILIGIRKIEQSIKNSAINKP